MGSSPKGMSRFASSQNVFEDVLPSFPQASTAPMPFIIGIIVMGLIFIPVIWKSGELTAVCDAKREPLYPIRVRVTQVFALFCVYLVAFWQGDEGIISLLPLILSIVGVAIFPLIKPLLPQINLEKLTPKKAD